MLEEKMPKKIKQILKTLPDCRQPNYCAEILKSFNFKVDANSVNNADSDPLNIRTLGQFITF